MSVENTRFGAAAIADMLKRCKSVYFIGIGGINMSSLAHITYRRGFSVGGSDRTPSKLTQTLEKVGITVNYSHEEQNVYGYDAFVYTVAISEDNPEYAYAKRAGKPCISRADYLGYIMMGYKTRIGISGMHGKSSCTSMCAEIMLGCGSSPTVLSGAELASMGGAYCLGESRNFVFEACEYMDSFLHFNPTVAVVLNIEMDHVDYFKSMEQIKESFASFASITGVNGYAVYNADDKNVIEALSCYKGHRISFGIDNKDSHLRAENITEKNGRYSFDVISDGKQLIRIDLGVSGYHNIYNALAATAACLLGGIPIEDIADGLSSFRGACRRMEYKGNVNGGCVFDDYGHHPTEISATLNGARAMTDSKLICVYQPHTYSRTAALFDEFVNAFESCERVIFVDIYAARETNSFGVSSEGLARAVGERALYAESFEAAAKMLTEEMSEGDIGVVMGAGDIWKVFECLTFDGGNR